MGDYEWEEHDFDDGTGGAGAKGLMRTLFACDRCNFIRPTKSVGNEMICKPCYDEMLERSR